jgi:predicted Mrr-cat superfamily restriction endonuclease
MEAGDYVITPCSDSQWLYYGRVADLPYCYAPNDRDGCPFPHRRPVSWSGRRINLSEFSEEFRRALKFTQKTAFRVKQGEEFISKITQRVFPAPKYSKDEIADRAKKIYEDKIKAKVEPKENGKFIVIDIESGDYEIDEEELEASERLKQRRPDSIRFLARVGCKAAYHMGWGGPEVGD